MPDEASVDIQAKFESITLDLAMNPMPNGQVILVVGVFATVQIQFVDLHGAPHSQTYFHPLMDGAQEEAFGDISQIEGVPTESGVFEAGFVDFWEYFSEVAFGDVIFVETSEFNADFLLEWWMHRYPEVSTPSASPVNPILAPTEPAD
jgi:hypothetical protein